MAFNFNTLHISNCDFLELVPDRWKKDINKVRIIQISVFALGIILTGLSFVVASSLLSMTCFVSGIYVIYKTGECVLKEIENYRAKILYLSHPGEYDINGRNINIL